MFSSIIIRHSQDWIPRGASPTAVMRKLPSHCITLASRYAKAPSRTPRIHRLSTWAKSSVTKRAEPGTVIGYMTDVEGNYDFWERYVDMSRVVYRCKVSGDVKLREGCEFVFGGDSVDRGPGDLRVQRELVDLKERYPDRVHLILGNRDINKLRFITELNASTQSQNLGFYWVKNHPYFNSPVERLKWILPNTMGCPESFNYRRQELALLSNQDPSDISDEEVLKSFKNAVEPEGYHWRYLSLGHLAFSLNDILFIHGAVCSHSLGFVPPSFKQARDMKSKGPAASVKSGVAPRSPRFSEIPEFSVPDWLERLEAFKQSELKHIEDEREFNTNWSATGGYFNDVPGARLMQYGMGRLPPPERQRTRSVVYNDFTHNGSLKDPDLQVCEALYKDGIRRIASGHRPHGDAPLFLRCRSTDLTITTADTSYSKNTQIAPPNNPSAPSLAEVPNFQRGGIGDQRGNCASEVLYTVGEDGKTTIIAHGKLNCGSTVIARVSQGPESCGDDFWVGRRTKTGWWIKGRVLAGGVSADWDTGDGVAAGGNWLLTQSTGFYVWNRIVDSSVLSKEM